VNNVSFNVRQSAINVKNILNRTTVDWMNWFLVLSAWIVIKHYEIEYSIRKINVSIVKSVWMSLNQTCNRLMLLNNHSKLDNVENVVWISKIIKWFLCINRIVYVVFIVKFDLLIKVFFRQEDACFYCLNCQIETGSCCQICHEPFLTGEYFSQFNGQFIHQTCFRCDFCRQIIDRKGFAYDILSYDKPDSAEIVLPDGTKFF